MMASHPASESPLRLTVGALVAYECLLDEAAGTTSWRVGAVRELPQHHSSERMTYADVVKGVAGAASEHPSTEQPSSMVHDDTDSPPLHVSGTAGQTVLIQPWISLAAATATPEASAAAQPAGRQASPSPQPQHQPQQQQQAVTPAVRFAEIEAMQRELEEIERFARGDSRTHADGDEQDKEEEALAKTLSLAYGRLLASASQPQWGGMADSGRHSTDGCLSASQSANEESGVDANPELTRQIEEKRAEFRQRIEHVMAEMKETRQKQRELQQEEAAAQKSLDDARLQLRETQEKVQKIDMRALREIQSYRLPPAVVKLVMSAVLCVLGERAGTWQDVVNAMRGSTFIANVAAFDSSQLTAGRLNELKRTYISDPHFSHEDAVKGSQALGQFHEWVMRQVQLVDADGYLEKFRKRKEASTAALVETRKQLESDAAELTHLEQELDALLHERVRQQEQLMLSRSGATASPRSAAAGDAVEHSAEGTAADLQGDSHTGVTEAQTRPRQLSVFSAPGGGDGATMVVACDGDSSDERGAAGRRGSTTMAQQQQLLALLPPGSQWACPPAGAVLSTHILRSSILCVLGHTGADEANNASSLPGLSTTAPDAADSEAGAAESAVLELSDAQQRSIEDALRQPWPERPPMPLTAEEAAAEAARRATTTSHHVRVFEGDEWDMVVEDSPEELRRALVDDIAAVCHVPNRAVQNVEWVVGSLHVQCDISHPAEVSDKELQQWIDDGDFPALSALYASRHQARAARGEQEAIELQQANRLVLLEREKEAAQQAEAEARQELREAHDGFERQRQELAEQMAATQRSSQKAYADEARAREEVQDAMEKVQSELKAREAELADMEARLQQLDKEAKAAAQEAEERHAAAVAALQQRLAEQTAATEAATAESHSATTVAAEQMTVMATALAEAKERAAASEQRAAAEKSALQEEVLQARRELAEAALKEAARSAKAATTTTSHTIHFEGDEWDMVVEDSPEELRRAVVADVAAISDLPASAVHDVLWTVGSLHVQCDVSHPAEVSDKELQQRLESGTYPTVMKVYDDARQRRARQEADAAAEAEAARRTAALEQQLHDSLAAQERLARELQASEVAHAAALKSTEQEKETTLRNAKEAAEQRVDELTKQLEEAEAARKEQEARREEEAAEAEKAHRATQQELEDTKQKLRAADDAVKQRDSDLAKQQEVRQEETAEAEAKAAEAEAKAAEAEAKAAEAEAKAAEAEKAQHATQQELEEVQERLQVTSDALKELQNEIHRETKQSQAAQQDRDAAQQRVDELTQQLEEAEAARKEQEARWGQEVSEAQVTAGAAAAAEEKHRATQQELEDTKQKLRVASDVLKKLEIQSRKDAKEAERRLLAAEKAQQQLAAESRKTEKESAELERKLRAAQAALQEQGKIHHAEVVKLLAKIADSEAARRQLQEAHTAARGAAQQAEERKAAQAAAEQRWADAQAALAVAVVARRDVAVAAQQHCEAETRRHADAAAEAAKRREERRAALERIREKAAALAETTVDGGAAPDAEAARQSKDAMAQEVAQELRAMRRERASVDADVAHSRRSVVARQQEVSRASLNVERQQRRVEEETEHRRALAPDGDAAAVTESAAMREAELEALRAEVAAADAGFAAACAELAAREEQRLRDCAEDEAELAALLCVEGGLDRTSGADGAVAQVMREVHERATSSFLQRHPVAVMNSCLGGLLITALATLQYKKYAV